MLFVRQDSNHDYKSTLGDPPAGLSARIVRLTTSLDFDAMVTVDRTTAAGMPVDVTANGSPINCDRIVLSKSFHELHEAEAWIMRIMGGARW